ncbi:MAG: hypothetical protein LBH45_03675 [Campylobacteraceae bacterium]|jgi:hypothetical protein|nr:hypothetical protein [Campylobacteraceae bacterium]
MSFIIIYAKYLYKIPNLFIRTVAELIPVKRKRQNFRNKLFKAHIKYFYKKLSVTTLSKKIVICRPHGGFNDMLVRIEKCYEYAKLHDRVLYVDTSRSGFLDDFDKYFIAPKGVFLNLAPLLFLSQNISKSDYEKLKIIINSPFDTEAVFDFSKDYDDQILIYEKSGGGDKSILMFEKLSLKDDVKSYIRNIIDSLGEYDALHVRNSDYKTDYKKFFAEISNKLDKKITLCTDSHECQVYAKELWGDRLEIVANAPNIKGKPLHNNKKLDRFQTNMNALTDLFVLACSKNLYFTTMKKGWISGFGNLAKSLHERQDLIYRLLYQ